MKYKTYLFIVFFQLALKGNDFEKSATKKLAFFFLIFFFFFILVNCQRTRDKMYDSITGASCFRRLNGTHQTGCSCKYSFLIKIKKNPNQFKNFFLAKFGGSTGVIHLVKTTEDFDFLINNPPSPPYAPVIFPHLFTRENILKLKNSKDISVLVLINNTTKMNSFSEESKCPNQFGGLIGEKQTCDIEKPETTWNPYGTGLLQENFPFPIFYVQDREQILKLTECFEKFNNFDYSEHDKRSLCSIEIKSFMSAAVNSEVCMRRTKFFNNLSNTRFCDPLFGKNVYSSLFPREILNVTDRENDKNEKFILVTARMDTTTMFDGIGLGAMGSLVPLATLVSTAHLLGRLNIQRNSSDKQLNVLFVLFNGEAYDYIGSQRFVYDLKKNSFPARVTMTRPINLENIEILIDLGTLDDPSNIKMYHSKQFEMSAKILNLMNKYNEKYNLNVSTIEQITENNFPPTSAQSFLRENFTLPALVLQSKPKNPFYHSLYDDSVNLDYKYENTSLDFTELSDLRKEDYNFKSNSIQMAIRNMSTVLAFTIYELVAGEQYTGLEGASAILADEFLYCFLISADCPLFKSSAPPNSLPWSSAPPLRYISVQTHLLQESTGWIYRIMGLLGSQKFSEISEENCTVLPFHWFSGFNESGECRLTTQNFSQAYSPAFFEDGKIFFFQSWVRYYNLL